jgi:hypothetical protein
VIRAAHIQSPARRDGADTNCRVALIAGGSAMGVFTLLGLGAATGWLEARVGLVGATMAIVVYVITLVHLHRKEEIQ